MGRWAQRRRRATQGEGTTPPTPNPVSIVSVRGDGTDWIITFDGPVTLGAGNDDSAFFVGDATVFHCDSCVGSAASGTDDGTGGYVSGLAWDLSSQPAWLATPIAGPQSGVTV